MAEIPVFTVSIAGGKPTFAIAAVADTARTGPGYTLIVKNTDVAAKTVTVVYPGNLPSGDPIPDKAYIVAANTGEEWIPLLDEYRDATTGQAAVTYSAITNVTRVVVKAG
jgi:hypothetical protein